VSNGYSETWPEYRKARNRALLATLGFLPGMFLISLVLRVFPRSAIADYVWAACGFAGILAVLGTGAVAQSLACPRCGKTFARKWWDRRSILLPGTCAHRGLRKYAQDDSSKS